jgi:hypothetical protein
MRQFSCLSRFYPHVLKCIATLYLNGFLIPLKKYLVMQSIIITPKSKESGLFLQQLLLKLNDVDHIEVVEEKEEQSIAVLSESSLAKEWDSKEDEIWDVWAIEKLQQNRP